MVASKFIQICNKGTLDRKFIELIGLSSKGDTLNDPGTIGFKGSGLKLAAVAALRLGLTTAISSTDELGRYFLTFDSEPIRVQGKPRRQVHYVYYELAPDGQVRLAQRFPSHLVVEAFADWDRPIGDDDKRAYKILREHLSNAIDEDKSYRIEPRDATFFANPGETCVFLANTPEISAMLGLPSQYFKFRSEQRPLWRSPLGQIWPKSQLDRTRLFIVGVLVDCVKGSFQDTIFDYSLDDKSLLSEERILKDRATYVSRLGQLLGSLDDKNLAQTVVSAMANGVGSLEEQALGSLYGFSLTDRSRAVWRGAVEAVWGKRVCVSTHEANVNRDAADLGRYVVVGGGSLNLRGFLRKLGYPDASEVVPRLEESDYSQVAFEEFDADSRSRFLLAWSILMRHFPLRAKYPVGFFWPESERLKTAAGLAIPDGQGGYSEVWVRAVERRKLGSLAELLATLVHETRHCVTGAHDADRAFAGMADQEVVAVMLREAAQNEVASGSRLPPMGKPTAAPAPTFLPIKKKSP